MGRIQSLRMPLNSHDRRLGVNESLNAAIIGYCKGLQLARQVSLIDRLGVIGIHRSGSVRTGMQAEGVDEMDQVRPSHMGIVLAGLELSPKKMLEIL